jgi:predicted dehydrogenase
LLDSLSAINHNRWNVPSREEGGVPARLRVGVIGCGLIAQVMHLPHLAELAERFQLLAVCDLSASVADACARRFGAALATTRQDELLDARLDAVLVLTGGSHAPAAVAAAERGLHVFVEKPLAFSVEEGAEMLAAAERAGVALMVGTMKRYDPAVARLSAVLAETDDLRLVRVTTLESPLEPYVAHLPLVRGALPPDVAAALRAEDEARLDAALGDVDAEARWCYRWILLDNLVHELNLLRGVLGEPTRVEAARLDRRSAALLLRFGELPCHLSWVDLPGIARYSQELAFYAPARRASLRFPSPFLRNMPTELVLESGEPGTAHAWRTRETVSYDEAFKRELVEFADAIDAGRPPLTSGVDGLRDLALCAAILDAHLTGRAVDAPSEPRPAAPPVS